jgi:hypothetical protein
MTSRQVNRQYLNSKQLSFYLALQAIKVFVGGRGAGKSTIMGFEAFRRVQELPRSKGFVLGCTYQQILTRFLPPMIDVWGRMGYRRHVSPQEQGHFVIGVRPPDHWPRPFQPPEAYHNVISWCNGSAMELISFDRKDVGRGGNYDWGILDEAFLINKDRYDREISPSLRGNNYRWPENPLLHSTCIFSSMPWLLSGMWVPDMEKLAQQYPEEFFYLEATSYDNLAVLGDDYIRRQARSLPALVFDVEIMNKRISKLPNGFYPSFDDKVHVVFDTWSYTLNEESGLFLPSRRDYSSQMPISLSFDFNAAFNSMTVIQTYDLPTGEIEERFIKNLYVKYEIVDNLVDLFIKQYENHGKKDIYVYGDRNGNNKQANSEQTIYESIKSRLEKAGWNVSIMVDGLDTAHSVKYTWLDRIHREDNPNLPRVRINGNTCPELVVSINNSPISPEFKKVKTSERNPNLPQERATHLSDTYDNYLCHKYKSVLESEGGSTFEAMLA